MNMAEETQAIATVAMRFVQSVYIKAVLREEQKVLRKELKSRARNWGRRNVSDPGQQRLL
ncbi:MAG: hypothetical protein H0X25_13010 [Acidobacteriales bacterium]|nr:hypothetical protein [Terriglobales bacterium]